MRKLSLFLLVCFVGFTIISCDQQTAEKQDTVKQEQLTPADKVKDTDAEAPPAGPVEDTDTEQKAPPPPPPRDDTDQKGKLHQPPPLEKSKDGVIVHIKHDSNDPQQALMGLLLADSFTETHQVLVYLDVKGVNIAIKGNEDIMFKGHSVNEALETLIKKKVEIMTCPGCLQAAGHEPKMLKDGITLRNNNDFFDFAEGRILTFDY